MYHKFVKCFMFCEGLNFALFYCFIQVDAAYAASDLAESYIGCVVKGFR